MSAAWSLVLHGGAGPLREGDEAGAEAHMAATLRAGGDALASGRPALDVVQTAVAALEESGFHIAGRGASPNAEGRWELDAAIMNGQTREAGSVAALRGFRSPVAAARKVLDHSPHVLLVGKGATRFLKPYRLARVRNPREYYRPAVTRPVAPGELAHGTVGAVALDTRGRLAAATSTGGLLGKTPGRVGDSPIIGAGTWADERVAVSCTGQGEYFMRCAVAADISARVRYARAGLGEAAGHALEDVRLLGGDGGLIAVDVLGNVTMPFTSQTMKRGVASSAGRFEVATRRRA
ncbi:MAG: isoaspartyl peptidase/L-asparaginase [Alphaproteobacteria bacterium]|jgi:isoaspartyl peptidase/L-asparaginase-like protein (Ntn-hydrolase superfamily)|nr:isoaspartyl peptidase/L-asparaginase [Alphaproteobacteria bacterium]